MIEKIASRLKLLRMALEKTAEDVGHEIGYSANHIWQIERATSKPNIEFIAKICKVYAISIDTLVHGTDKEFQAILNEIYSRVTA